MRRKAPSPEALGGIITTSYGPNRAPVGLTRARASGEQSLLSPYPGPLAPHGSSVRYPQSGLINASVLKLQHLATSLCLLVEIGKQEQHSKKWAATGSQHALCWLVVVCNVGITSGQQQAIGTTRQLPQSGLSSLPVIQQITEQLITWLPEIL